jgi:hypothetical protein
MAEVSRELEDHRIGLFVTPYDEVLRSITKKAEPTRSAA